MCVFIVSYNAFELIYALCVCLVTERLRVATSLRRRESVRGTRQSGEHHQRCRPRLPDVH